MHLPELIIQSHRTSFREIRRIIKNLAVDVETCLKKHFDWIVYSGDLSDLCKRLCVCICFENHHFVPRQPEMKEISETLILIDDPILADTLGQLEVVKTDIEAFCKMQGVKSIVAKQNLAKARLIGLKKVTLKIDQSDELRWEYIQKLVERESISISQRELEIVCVAHVAWSREIASQRAISVLARSIKSLNRKLIIEEPNREPQSDRKINLAAESGVRYKTSKSYEVMDRDANFGFRIAILEDKLILTFREGKSLAFFGRNSECLGILNNDNRIMEIRNEKRPSELVFRVLGI